MDEFPPNSRKAEQRAREPIERVTSAEGVRRKKPLGKQFSNLFFGGDGRSAFDYSIGNVLIPAIKVGIVDTLQSAIERIFYGDSGYRSRRYRPGSPDDYRPNIPYNRMGSQTRPSDRPPLPRALSRSSRARHDFDDIIINSRQEAEEVIDRLFDLVSKYDSATIADLYELTGLESSHTDHKWGWTDLRGATVGRVRGGGYLLELPEPEFFS